MITLYITYLYVAIAVTIWTGRTLKKHGQTLLAERFPGNEPLVSWVNHLLVTGFYLVCLGMITLALPLYGQKPYSSAQGVEFLATKVGGISLFLAAVYFYTFSCFTRFRGAGILPEPAEPETPIDQQRAETRNQIGGAVQKGVNIITNLLERQFPDHDCATMLAAVTSMLLRDPLLEKQSAANSKSRFATSSHLREKVIMTIGEVGSAARPEIEMITRRLLSELLANEVQRDIVTAAISDLVYLEFLERRLAGAV